MLANSRKSGGFSGKRAEQVFLVETGRMKALILADTRPSKPLDQLLKEVQPEIVITLGDLDYHSICWLKGFDGPKLGVYGNHCGSYMEELGIVNMHCRHLELGGLTFAGFEGCHRYKQIGAYQYSQAEARQLLDGFGPADILICHSPPYGINDHPDDQAHVGFEALRDYVDRFPPLLLLHGHTYPTEPVSLHGQTEILYVYGDAVCQLPIA